MSSIVDIFKFIWRHPLASRKRGVAIKRFLKWQFGQRILSSPVLCMLVEDSVLLIEKGMAGATGNIYTGLMEFEDMSFVLHVLRSGDIFADVGANVGAYTILASRNAGAEVISVEPIPDTFGKLKRNVLLNNVGDRVTLLPFGAGDKESVLKFTSKGDAVNHVVGKNEQEGGDSIEIPVRTLDELAGQLRPMIMKLDVEGFEWPALNGAKRLLTELKGLIIELNGCSGRYGFSDDEIHSLLLSYGFKPFSYEPFSRKLTAVASYGVFNTIYIKEQALEWIGDRLRTSRKFRILEQDV